MSRTVQARARRTPSAQRQCKLLCLQLFLLHACIVYLCLLHATHNTRRRRRVELTTLATAHMHDVRASGALASASPATQINAANARRTPQPTCQPTRTVVYFANHSRGSQFTQHSLRADTLAVAFMQRVASQWNAVPGTQTAVLVLLPHSDESNTSLARISNIFTSMCTATPCHTHVVPSSSSSNKKDVFALLQTMCQAHNTRNAAERARFDAACQECQEIVLIVAAPYEANSGNAGNAATLDSGTMRALANAPHGHATCVQRQTRGEMPRALVHNDCQVMVWKV